MNRTQSSQNRNECQSLSNNATTTRRRTKKEIIYCKSHYSIIILYFLFINSTFLHSVLGATDNPVTDVTLSPTTNDTSTPSITSSYYYDSSYSSSSTYLPMDIPMEWDYGINTTNEHTSEEYENRKDSDFTYTTTYINNSTDNITRIIYCYTIIHLNTTSSNDIEHYVNESIVNSFINVLQGVTGNVTAKDDIGNIEDNFSIDSDWKIINVSSGYYIPSSLSKSLSFSDNGKYTATSIYTNIHTYVPYNQTILKDILLSNHITTYIGNNIKEAPNDDIIQSSMYFQPITLTKQFELSFISNISSDLLNEAKSNEHQHMGIKYLLNKLYHHWNNILSSNNDYPLNIHDDIKLNICSDKKEDCNLNVIVKHEEETNDNEDGIRLRENQQHPVLGGEHRYLQERKLPSLGGMMSNEDHISTQEETNFCYILLPLNMTLEYYIPNKYINYETIFHSLDKILVHDKDYEVYWMDFYKNLLMLLGYHDSTHLDSSTLLDVSLSYISSDSKNENDKNKDDNDTDDDLYYNTSDYYFDPNVFKNILQLFIAMFVILSICLILVYCGKFQDRRKRQKIVPFDGSIPVEI